MVDAERVTRLVATIRRDVGFLRSLAARDPDELLADPVAMAAIKYGFVVALEGCARCAHHISVSEGWEVPETNAEAVASLADHGVIEAPLASSLARAFGFRNVLVHGYTSVDDTKVMDYLGRLHELDDFCTALVRWIDEQQKAEQ